jgi:hypothetical protein
MLDTEPDSWMCKTTADNLDLYAGALDAGDSWVAAVATQLRGWG